MWVGQQDFLIWRTWTTPVNYLLKKKVKCLNICIKVIKTVIHLGHIKQEKKATSWRGSSSDNFTFGQLYLWITRGGLSIWNVFAMNSLLISLTNTRSRASQLSCIEFCGFPDRKCSSYREGKEKNRSRVDRPASKTYARCLETIPSRF